MKFVSEFRDGDLAQRIAENIRHEARSGRALAFMEFCGGHTHAIARYGLTDLLPQNLRMIHGPGCPVCVLPVGRIDMALNLALERGVMLCSYGDVMRVPASAGLSLIRAKALGADIRMVYSPRDALQLAVRNPGREVVFLAIGFETTAPATALALREAIRADLSNFSVMCCHVLTPPAIASILAPGDTGGVETPSIDGFVGPAHVSIVIGSAPYAEFARQYRKPVVIAGFEPLDVMQAILMLARQVNSQRSVVENEFTRAVSADGNLRALAVIEEIFEVRPEFEWRGLGVIQGSALRIRRRHARFDAEERYAMRYRAVADHRQCDCGLILRGVLTPPECKLFGTVCTPDTPMGSCMVSSEGACAAHYTYGRFRDPPSPARSRSRPRLAARGG